MKNKSLLCWLISFWLAASAAGASRTERLLLKFYARTDPKVQAAYLHEVCQRTEKWLKRARLLDMEDTFLSMGHRESGFNMFSDDGQSYGVYQTLKEFNPWLREWWHLRGYELGPDDSLDTQCAFGAAEFRVHLNRAGGNVWGGVRRYNGSGKKARIYAEHVFISRRVIFGHPHFDGESVKVDPIKVKRK